MRREVIVTFDRNEPIQIELSHVEAMPVEAARQWLDQQFLDLGCQPLRPTGKALTVDKVVVVAEAAGPEKFADAAWSQNFGLAVNAALGKAVVTIDVATLSITY